MTEVDQDKSLTELELKVLIESRKKSVSEVASILGISPTEVSRTLEQANRKVSSDYIRSLDETVFLPRPISFRLEKKIGEQQIGTMKAGTKG